MRNKVAFKETKVIVIRNMSYDCKIKSHIMKYKVTTGQYKVVN